MKPIKDLSQTNLDLRQAYLVQELPFDVKAAVPAVWNGTEGTHALMGGEFPAEIIAMLQRHLDYAHLKGFYVDGCFFVYDWPWEDKNFERRYNRMADKTGAFLRTLGSVALVNAEYIKLSDLAKRKPSVSLIWDDSPSSEPFIYESR